MAAETNVEETLSLPRLRPRLVEFEQAQAGGEIRPALRKRIQPRAKEDVLTDAARNLFNDQVCDEPGPGQDGSQERRVHGPMSGRSCQPASGAASLRPTSNGLCETFGSALIEMIAFISKSGVGGRQMPAIFPLRSLRYDLRGPLLCGTQPFPP